MRRFVVILAFLWLLPLAAQEKLAAKMVSVSKREVLKEGSLSYRITGLVLRPGTDYFTLSMTIQNVTEKENVKRLIWSDRLRGAKFMDDRGREYKPVTLDVNDRKLLPPGSVAEWSWNLGGKPNPKAKYLLFTLPESKAGPEVTFQIPFTMLRAP
jgi:hypothetical protein